MQDKGEVGDAGERGVAWGPQWAAGGDLCQEAVLRKRDAQATVAFWGAFCSSMHTPLSPPEDQKNINSA